MIGRFKRRGRQGFFRRKFLDVKVQHWFAKYKIIDQRGIEKRRNRLSTLPATVLIPFSKLILGV